MNRNDTSGSEPEERGRESNGGRDFYPGSHGFDDAGERTYGGREGSAEQMQPPHGRYERDEQQRAAGERQSEHWHGGFERSPRYGSRGSGSGRHEPDRYRPVTHEWKAARGYGGGASELGYGGGQGRYGEEDQFEEDQRAAGRYGSGGYGPRGYGPGAYYEPASYGQGRYGRESASQPYYGPRAHRSDRSSWQDQYGFGQPRDPYRPESYSSPAYREGSSAGHLPRDRYRHSSEQLFDREPFGRREDTHYYGTGAAGWGGPGFTGGAYAYGSGPRDQRRSLESEYSDESAVGYGQGYRRGYGGGGGYGVARGYGAEDVYGRYGGPRNRPYPPGPKGYRRSDERLKEDISERLMESYHIDSSEVMVEVRGAKVILEGVVPRRHMKHAIEDLVDGCPGVQDVDNRVRVASPDYQGSAATSTSSMPYASGSEATSEASRSTLQSSGSGGSGSSTTSPNGMKSK